jgi:hypothetical protein
MTINDVVAEMKRRGSPYATSTIATMMSSHMCAGVTGPNVSPYEDLERVDRGRYRLRRPSV